MKQIKWIMMVFFTFFVLQNLLFAQEEKPYFVGKDSKEFLLKAKELHPDNYTISYYLGQIYMDEGNLDEAIAEWERYLSLSDKEDSKTTAVRERLTILKLNLAKDLDPRVLEKQIGKNTVAVLNFTNLGAYKQDVISKGLTAMMITDLSSVPDLKVVEREKMQALINEMRLAEGGIVSEETAAKTGKMLLAKHIVRGTINYPAKDEVSISSVVTETMEPKDVGKPDAKGRRDDFFDLQKKLLFGILESLGYKMEDLNPALRKTLEKFHTKNFNALLSYAKGLDYLDKGMLTEANNAFKDAVSLDSDFDLAKDAMINIPSAELPGGADTDLLVVPDINIVEPVVSKKHEETPMPPDPPDFEGETPQFPGRPGAAGETPQFPGKP